MDFIKMVPQSPIVSHVLIIVKNVIMEQHVKYVQKVMY